MSFKNKKKSSLIIFGGFAVAATSVALLASCGGGSKTSGYNVTYHATSGRTINGNESFTATNVKEVAAEPEAKTTKSAERFDGWFTNSSYTGYKVEFPLKVTSDMVLYAKWVPDYSGAVHVSFDSNKGSSVPTYLLNTGDSIESQPTSTRENYRFLGWKKSASSDFIQFPFTPSEDTSLVACWEQEAFKAKFHTAGSKPENTTEVSTNVFESNTESRTIQSAPYTTFANHTFDGWYDDPDGGNLITFPYDLNENNLDLYAHFSATKSIKVTLHDNVTGVEKVLENCSSVPYAPAPIREDATKKFLGWAATEGGELITDYTPYISLSNNVDLYAKWSDKDKKTVYLKDNDGTDIRSIEYCVDDVISEAPAYGSDEYFDFYGWFTEKEGGGSKVEFPLTVTDNLTLYANCKRSAFDIKIMDSEHEDTVLLKEYSKASSVSLPTTISIPGREEDYKFLNYYYYEKGSTTPTILPTQSYLFDLTLAGQRLTKDENSFTLYAAWNTDGRRYKIDIDYGNGDSDFIYRTKEQGDTFTVDDDDFPQRTVKGKKLVYYTDEDGNQYNVGSYTPINIREITLTAHWEENTRSIKVHRGGAEKPKEYTEETVTIESKTSGEGELKFYYSDIPVSPEDKPKYNFAGFYTDDPLTTESPTFHYVDDELESNITEVWECWEQEYADVTIKYIDDADKSTVLKTVTKTDLYAWWDYEYGTIKSTITDYEPQSMTLNGKAVEISSEGFDKTVLNFGEQVDNILIVYTKKVSFTVTFKSQCTAETQEDHIEYHQSTIPDYTPPTPQESSCSWVCWCYDKEGEQKAEAGTKITDNTVLYGKWKYDPEYSITCTFNVGSSQMLAQFSDGSTEKTVTKKNAITPENFPAATCEGCLFAGWYDSEVGGTLYADSITKDNLPKDGVLYARWKPLSGYLSICLDLGENGTFTKTGSSTTLLTVNEGTTWGSVKNSVPESSYDNGEYTVTNWSLDGKTGLADDYEFSSSTPKFLKPIIGDNIQTPSDFATDNWATIIAVAENKVKKKDGTYYDNGKEALVGFYNLAVGDTRPLGYQDFAVRVISLGQDYGSSSTGSTQHLPITFELTKLIDLDVYKNSTYASSWTGSDLKKKLDDGGDYFELMPSIIQSHMATTYKYTGRSTLTAHKLFIPSAYEIGASSSKTGQEFKYTLYNDSKYLYTDKNFLEIGPCNYWVRNVTGGNNSTPCRVDISDDGESWSYITDSAANIYRGICLMFCLGTAY